MLELTSSSKNPPKNKKPVFDDNRICFVGQTFPWVISFNYSVDIASVALVADSSTVFFSKFLFCRLPLLKRFWTNSSRLEM